MPANTKDEKRNTAKAQTSKTLQTQPTLSVDVEFYQSFLDDADTPDAQKRQLVETLWSIMTGFIDLGFGVHPAQSAQEAQSKTLAPLVTNFDRAQAKTTARVKTEETLPERPAP